MPRQHRETCSPGRFSLYTPLLLASLGVLSELTAAARPQSFMRGLMGVAEHVLTSSRRYLPERLDAKDEKCAEIFKKCDFNLGPGPPKGGKLIIPGVWLPLPECRSPPITNKKNRNVFYASISPPDNGPPFSNCSTTGKKSDCKLFAVGGGSRLPGSRDGPPYITLARKDQNTLNAVKGKCFGLFLGEVIVAVGQGPGGLRRTLKWKDEGTEFKRENRCIAFKVL